MKNFKKIFLLIFYGLFFSICDAQVEDSGKVAAPEAIGEKQPKKRKEMVEEEEPWSPERIAYEDSINAIEAEYERRKPEYFMKYIYEPAMKRKNVSAQNIALLKQLKIHLACPPDSCINCNFLMPVYTFPDSSLRYRRSLGYNYELTTDDTILIPSEKKKHYKLYYAKSNRRENCNMTKFAKTTYAPTFILRKSKLQDTLEPVFMSELNLDLEYKKNEKLDSLLEDDWTKRNTKFWGIAQVYEFSFAQLKNVPGMYFYYGTGEAYTRGVAMIVDNRPLLLWHIWCHGRTFEKD